ncbi:MAG: hypothetical protein GXY07_15895 [Candidatus Hydrogenedentes bacterium]|nr:hypothetical protein [Candidatus Hydrogenedentota bacterium]
MIKRNRALMAFAVVLMVCVGIAWAQAPAPPPAPPAHGVGKAPAPPPGPGKGGPPMPPPEISEENRRLLKQVMVSRLSRDLGLNDEQSLLLMRRFDELQNRQRELQRERAEVMRRLRQVLKQQEDEAALHRLMERLEELKRQSAASEETIRRSFDGMDLNVWQKAKIELFINDFENQLRRIVQQARNGRPGQEKMAPGFPPRPPRDANRPGPQRPGRPPQDAPKPPPVIAPSNP